MKSPTKGMNSIKFIAAEVLLRVNEYNKLFVQKSNTSPIIGISNTGAAIKSKASAIIDIPRAEAALNEKDLSSVEFATFSRCMINTCIL